MELHGALVDQGATPAQHRLGVRVSVGVILAIILGVILGYTWVILGLYLE